MARSHARLELAMFSVDRDADLAALSTSAKLLYVVLLTDPAINFAGVVLLRTGVWAEDASLDDQACDVALKELERDRFVVVDRRTCELLVRSFIRNDGVAAQPNVLKSALAHALQVKSRAIRSALASELWRLPPRQPDRIGKNGRPVVYPDPHACAATLDPDSGPDIPSSNPSLNPSGNPSPNPSAGTLPGRDAGTLGGGGGGGGVSHLPSNSSSENSSSSAFADGDPEPETGRDDVDQLVTRLCDRLRENDVKIPGGLTAWRKQARLLLDRDKRDLTQALRLIDWATGHHFWNSNIQSMPKFREKYDQLLAQARQDQHRRTAASPQPNKTDARIAALLAGGSGPPAAPPHLRAIGGTR
jgi:hypothetical protein